MAAPTPVHEPQTANPEPQTLNLLPLPTGKYTGIVQCGRTIVAEEGARALWKGLTPFAMHLTLKYALRMGSNSVYQGLLRDKVSERA